MKLSEAIRMNGMMKPQGFGVASLDEVNAPCVVGGALQSIGRQAGRWAALEQEWPFVLEIKHYCPVCLHLPHLKPATLELILWHLNDVHRWTREQIAGWVATVEPAEPQEAPAPVEEVAVTI
jgi:hypothetical protein